jgi:O-antigen/teichoic acid export membrane protein
MSKNSLKRNFIVNLLYPSVRIAVALVTIPIYLRHVGEARYGVISIIWVLLGFFGFLDLGLSRAVTNALAKLRGAPQTQRARVLLTTFGLNLAIGLIGGGVLYLFGGFLLKYFISVPEALTPEVSRSLPWITCLLPLTLTATAGAGALDSRELFLLVNLLQIASMSLSQIAPVIMAVFVSPSLMVVIPTIVVAQALGSIAIVACVYRLEGPFSLRAVDWSEARKLLGYGGWMAATNMINPALASADQFIIGSAMGVIAVAHYAVPMNLVLRSGFIPWAFGRTFFPRMSSLSGDAAFALGARALSSMAYGFAVVCAPAIVLSPTFFRYWIGADFAMISAPVAQILFPGMWMSGLSLVGFTLLQSQGRADLTGKLSMLEFLPFLAILWALTVRFGIVGAAFAWSLRCTADALAIFWASGMTRRHLLPLLPPGALLVGTVVLGHSLGSNIFLHLLVAAFTASFAAALSYFFSEDWRTIILGLVKRALVAKPSPPVNTNSQK